MPKYLHRRWPSFYTEPLPLNCFLYFLIDVIWFGQCEKNNIRKKISQERTFEFFLKHSDLCSVQCVFSIIRMDLLTSSGKSWSMDGSSPRRRSAAVSSAASVDDVTLTPNNSKKVKYKWVTFCRAGFNLQTGKLGKPIPVLTPRIVPNVLKCLPNTTVASKIRRSLPLARCDRVISL